MMLSIDSISSPAFRYEPGFPEREEDRLSEVLITSSGEVVELGIDGSVLSECALHPTSPLRFQDASVSLQVFYTYQPFFKYYLAFIHNELFIIRKIAQGQLKLHKTFSEVKKFFISDSDNAGYPKIFVLYKGNSTPSVVDFYGSTENYSNVKLIGNALLKIRSQNQALCMRLKSAQNILIDKKIFVSKLSGMMLSVDLSEMGIPLIRILGDSSRSIECSKICSISCGKLWARSCSDSWIVGAYVFNELERELNDLEMVITNGEWFVERLEVWTKTNSNPLLSDFNSALTIPPRSEGVLVGVIKKPFFVSSKLELPVVLIYHVNGERGMKQCYIGNLDVSSQKYLTFDYHPFEKESDIADLLSLRMVCTYVDVSYQLSREVIDLHELLCSRSFSKLSEVYYVCKFSCYSPLRGVLIYLNNKNGLPYLRIFFRRKQQLVYLLESFHGKLTWSFLTHDSVNPADVLYKELVCLEKSIQLQSDKEVFQIPADYIPVLLEHEKNTEMAFYS